MTLDDLKGLHELTGVDIDTTEVEGWSGPTIANALLFELDGVVYRITEDEHDGYRSSMRDIEKLEGVTLKNTFAPVRVLARTVTGAHADVYTTRNDLLELVDVANGNTVLLIGTADHDDYYPSYTANWWPERLKVNEGK